VSDWISCVDRLPDFGTKVLVYGKAGLNVARYDRHSIKPGGFWWDSHAEYIRGVTHWMPLPAEPKE
jgi:hypothetical protein